MSARWVRFPHSPPFLDDKLARQLDLFAKQWAPRSGVCFEYTVIRHLAVYPRATNALKG